MVSRGGWHAEAADAGAGGVGGVGERPGVVHAGVREARVSQRRQRREGGPLLEQVRSPCWHKTRKEGRVNKKSENCCCDYDTRGEGEISTPQKKGKLPPNPQFWARISRDTPVHGNVCSK